MAIRWKATLLARALPRDPHVAKVAPRDDNFFTLATLDLLPTNAFCKTSNLFIVTLYYVTCCRDLCVETPLAGDVGDALPNVVC